MLKLKSINKVYDCIKSLFVNKNSKYLKKIDLFSESSATQYMDRIATKIEVLSFEDGVPPLEWINNPKNVLFGCRARTFVSCLQKELIELSPELLADYGYHLSKNGLFVFEKDNSAFYLDNLNRLHVIDKSYYDYYYEITNKNLPDHERKEQTLHFIWGAIARNYDSQYPKEDFKKFYVINPSLLLSNSDKCFRDNDGSINNCQESLMQVVFDDLDTAVDYAIKSKIYNYVYVCELPASILIPSINFKNAYHLNERAFWIQTASLHANFYKIIGSSRPVVARKIGRNYE